MAQIDSQKFYQDIDQGQIAALYLVTSEEPFLERQAYDFLRSRILPESDRDFNLEIFDSSDLDLQRLLDSLEQLPMMAPRRLVILRGIQDLKESDWEALLKYFIKPFDGLTFALIGEKVDKRKKYFKPLMENAQVVEFKKPFENQIGSWIRYMAHQRELQIDEDAVSEVHRLIGSHLGELDIAIENLFLALDGRKHINLADVESNLRKTKDESVFDLIEALGEKQKVKSLQLLSELLDQGQNEIGLVSLLSRQFRLIYKTLIFQKRGQSGGQLAQSLGVPPYFLKQYQSQARRWNEEQLEGLFVRLSTLDQRLKSSAIPAKFWFEEFILAIH